MNSVLYNAVTKDNIEVLLESEHRLAIDKQLTPTKDTVLHLASQYGSINCLEHMLSVHKSLLLLINSTGETALHLAAREGHFEVVQELLDAAKSSPLTAESSQNTSLTALQVLIRTTDMERETALHLAVRYNHKEVVQLLLNEDPSHVYPRNKYGETPLYMASFRCHVDIVKTILENSESPTFGGPNQRTALHAALSHTGGPACVKLLLEKDRGLIKKADCYGWTAFHYAAHNDLYSIVKDLVAADKSVGYLTDLYHGKTALHVAAYQGNYIVMHKLVQYFPDSLQTVDWQGRNILHIAAEQDQKKVINFIMSLNYKELNKLMNRRDREGNTPLHLVARFGCYLKKLMVLTKGSDWDVLNNEGLSPLDVIDDVPIDSYTAGHMHEVKMKDPEKRKNKRQRVKDLTSRYVEKYEKAINTHIIVAALIATVALTAGFAMPGGFNSTEGSKYAGSPMLLPKAAFWIFIITDATALVLSIISLFLYFLTILYKEEGIVGQSMFWPSCVLNGLSIVAMMVAFMSGTFAILAAHALPLAIIVCLVSFPFFLFLLYAFISLYIYQVAEYKMVVFGTW
ncbi:hypothetical protein DCAR_0936044 [Daucus carota subsp. sativus]|uniref:PGG domain-containing protein n=1 Tax=Daucus carota subsp. sativus TaxID=79200 RepID=A0AAF1BE69_DAUCS|nr:hypothetical protein DCAR_0936044 [Daucus carota subsp. sativus]